MPYKKRDGEVLVDPVALAGAVPAPYLQPGPLLGVMESAGPYEHPGTGMAASGPPVEPRAALLPAPGEVPPEPAPAAPASLRGCPSGHDNPAGQKFCGQCGSPLAEAPRWPCGHDNPDSNLFCGQCGRPSGQTPVASLAVELASRVAALDPARPIPEAELSPAQRAERERAHASAVAAGRVIPPLTYQPPRTSDTVRIHLLEDGLTWAGQVWFRGQEIVLDVGSARWMQAQSFINLTDFEQVERYGSIKFRQGPWPGKRYSDAAGQFQVLGHMDKEKSKAGVRVSGPSAEDLLRAETAEAQRRGGVPAPAVL